MRSTVRYVSSVLGSRGASPFLLAITHSGVAPVNTSGIRRLLITTLGVALLSTACASGTSSPTPASTPTSAAGSITPSVAPSETASEAPLAEKRDFIISSSVFGLSQVALLEAIDVLNNDGWNILAAELAQSELAAEGVASGQFHMSTGASNTVLQMVEGGADVKYVSDRVGNEWTIYAKSDITSCADLDGKRMAIHSPGAVSTAMVKDWINVNCPGTEPEYLVISGSQNRMAALQAGQVDASPLELADALQLDAESPDEFRLISSLAVELSDLHPTTLYAHGDFIRDYPGSIRAIIRAMLEENRKINADTSGAYLAQLHEKHLGEPIDPAIAQVYIELGIYPNDGGLTDEGVQFTLDFFTRAEVVQPGLTADQIADLSHLNAVLEEIGRD